ncbi:SAM-dependent methyltransferase [Arthrobacter sp. MYb227]|uniref:class I SAM-dependent methyltransferase n=1 Tax=Arthrobacter sp. MYb227 TaxID=1848601 RepID=UPI000CFBC27F|nr:class I SAM-dependent methyltransferase [Arthrobacter sp. MYb227]PQZ94998.1 SAM-dependent methyltransferase [Arthrobacter sp. MYb227]
MSNLYERFILPKLISVSCGNAVLDPLRDKLCAGLYGEVIELGFGSGTNIVHYPAEVNRVVGIEPSDYAWKLSTTLRQGARTNIVRGSLDGQVLREADESFDGALSAFTLCSIPNPHAALIELRRVLKPGGTVHFLEHGLAPNENIRRWQHRIEPAQKFFAGGCHLTRSHDSLLTEAGFRVTGLQTFYQPGISRIEGALSLGTAVRD